MAEINELVNNLAMFIGLSFSNAPSKSIITEDPTFGHDSDVIDFRYFYVAKVPWFNGLAPFCILARPGKAQYRDGVEIENVAWFLYEIFR